MSKSRAKPWICEASVSNGETGPNGGPSPCGATAHKHCPACDHIWCDACFGAHRFHGCPIYTGTDQCLCIWPVNAQFPACVHDMRGHQGAVGIQGSPKLFILIHHDDFSESHDVYGVFSTKEKAEESLKEVDVDQVANRAVQIVEYELDKFVKEGHRPEFYRLQDLQRDLEDNLPTEDNK